jgi:hypothetical protein
MQSPPPPETLLAWLEIIVDSACNKIHLTSIGGAENSYKSLVVKRRENSISDNCTLKHIILVDMIPDGKTACVV